MSLNANNVCCTTVDVNIDMKDAKRRPCAPVGRNSSSFINFLEARLSSVLRNGLQCECGVSCERAVAPLAKLEDKVRKADLQIT